MILVVDIGNSAAKFALFRGKRLVRSWRVLHGDPLPRLPEGIVRTAVSSVNPRALRRLLPLLPAPVLLAGRDFRIPLKGAPRRTGTDRLLAAYAAWRTAKGPVVVIDVGTAITLNVVDAKGRFLGGAIFAGPETALRALSRRTALLPAVKPSRASGLGRDTQSALRAGAALALRGFVREAVAAAETRLGRRPAVFLTGGGAWLLSPMPRGCRRDSALVLSGLARAVAPPGSADR